MAERAAGKRREMKTIKEMVARVEMLSGLAGCAMQAAMSANSEVGRRSALGKFWRLNRLHTKAAALQARKSMRIA